MQASDPVKELMTEAVLSIEVSAPAAEILRLFAEYPVHHLPVVDDSRVVGMLSSSDVMKLQSLIPKGGANRGDYLSWRFRIDQLMRQPAVTIGPEESVEKAASLMAGHGIHALPVTNSQDKLVGIITTTDIMNAALHPRRQGNATARADSGGIAPGAKLTTAEMRNALSLAVAAIGGADDKARIARALVHACRRLKRLEALRSWADRYVHVGHDERLHSALLQAVEQARDASVPAAPLPI